MVQICHLAFPHYDIYNPVIMHFFFFLKEGRHLFLLVLHPGTNFWRKKAALISNLRLSAYFSLVILCFIDSCLPLPAVIFTICSILLSVRSLMCFSPLFCYFSYFIGGSACTFAVKPAAKWLCLSLYFFRWCYILSYFLLLHKLTDVIVDKL